LKQLTSTALPQTSGNSKRKAHGIVKQKGVRYPQRFIFFDTETKPVDDKGTHKMVLAYAVYWQRASYKGKETVEWFDTENPVELFDFILSKVNAQVRLTVLSANIWFDLRVSGILPMLKGSGWACVKRFFAGHTFIASFKKDRLRIDFVNVQNYFNFPVHKIGESIGLPKLDADVLNASVDELRPYCKRDVEIIFQAYRSLYSFIRGNDLGSWGYTLPSIAFSCYTHSFIPQTISVHTQDDILELERKAYFGGRCECYKLGKFKGQRFYKIDVNAMYPFIMKENYFPTKFDKVGHNVKPEVLLKCANKWLYVAEVELQTDKPIYAHRMNDKLMFPVGNFTTYLTTGSLFHAIHAGHIKRIKTVAAYQKAKLFDTFVEYFYNKRLQYRKEKNPAFAYICKLILNSLYGKFGQRNSIMVSEEPTHDDRNFRERIWHVQEQREYMHTVFYGLDQLTLSQQEEGRNSMPAIAAHVTDYARTYLWYIMEKAGRVNCFYCDTDSVIVNRAGYKKLQDDLDADVLGMMKVEKVVDTMEIRGAKNYTFGGEEKIKGVKKSAKRTGEKTYEYTRFPTPLSELRNRLPEDYRVETVSKTLSGEYDKGIVLKSGKVIPHTLPLP